jgi:hypothetical protein
LPAGLLAYRLTCLLAYSQRTVAKVTIAPIDEEVKNPHLDRRLPRLRKKLPSRPVSFFKMLH